MGLIRNYRVIRTIRVGNDLRCIEGINANYLRSILNVNRTLADLLLSTALCRITYYEISEGLA